MKNIKLITDGSCDLSQKIIEDSKVEIVDVMVSFGEKNYSTRKDITISQFYEMMKNYSELPKTSCPSPNQFLEAFDCEQDNIIVLCLTSKLSGIYNSAVLAKNMYEEEHGNKKRIEIIDSTTGSIGQALLVSKVANMIDEDKTMDEIVNTIEKLKHEDLMKSDKIAKMLGYQDFENYDEVGVYTRGYRVLNKIPRMPSNIVDNLVKSFKSFQHILAADIPQLDEVEGIGEVRARTIKQSLKRMQEQFVFDNLIL